jgi:hypothetical protein
MRSFDMEDIIIENPTHFVFGELEFIQATIDGIQMSVPLDKANRHYAEILKQVEAGTLVIQPANED